MFGSPIAMNQTCYALRSKWGCHFALYCQLREVIDSLVHSAHGSVFDTITTSTFAASHVLLPPEPVLTVFEKMATPLFLRILAGECQSRLLASLRDALLPKLLTGTIAVSQLEAVIQ